ncbi:MAG: hypothetical protein AAF491_08550, partial [Verrucomicrobiota bacterium]
VLVFEPVSASGFCEIKIEKDDPFRSFDDDCLKWYLYRGAKIFQGSEFDLKTPREVISAPCKKTVAPVDRFVPDPQRAIFTLGREGTEKKSRGNPGPQVGTTESLHHPVSILLEFLYIKEN